LMLHRGTEGVLNAAAIERRNRLELVQRNRQLATARFCDAPRECEDFLRQPRDVPAGSGRRKRQGELAFAPFTGFDSYFRTNAAEHVTQPGAGLVDARLDSQKGAGVSLEEPDVGA